jgi:hypothetical protein
MTPARHTDAGVVARRRTLPQRKSAGDVTVPTGSH